MEECQLNQKIQGVATEDYADAERKCVGNDHLLGRTPSGRVVCLCAPRPTAAADSVEGGQRGE